MAMKFMGAVRPDCTRLAEIHNIIDIVVLYGTQRSCVILTAESQGY